MWLFFFSFPSLCLSTLWRILGNLHERYFQRGSSVFIPCRELFSSLSRGGTSYIYEVNWTLLPSTYNPVDSCPDCVLSLWMIQHFVLHTYNKELLLSDKLALWPLFDKHTLIFFFFWKLVQVRDFFIDWHRYRPPTRVGALVDQLAKRTKYARQKTTFTKEMLSIRRN